MDQSNKKLSLYRRMELDIQQQWAESKTFEVDAPGANSNGKFFSTFPYPYMNGKLHLGHSFSISKVEFSTAYQRLLGKSCLFPLGFHCTGMPILACADKLKREVELYGFPPKFPEIKDPEPKKEENNEVTRDKAKSKKSKAQAKTGPAKFQWEIMKDCVILSDEEKKGLSDEEIAAKVDDEIIKFVDPVHWFKYFPAMAIHDLQLFGIGIDWRRAFITTEINPFYDSFVRWQFLRLKQKDKIKFGKRYTIYSPKDKQPCMDHDRASGEGVLPQERKITKVKLFDEIPGLDGPIYLLASIPIAGLKSSQPNVFVNPKATYSIFKTTEGLVIGSAKAARNMSYQDLTSERGQVEIIKEISGQELCNKTIDGVLGGQVLPKNVSIDQATGIEIQDKEDSVTEDSKPLELKHFIYMEPEREVISRSGDVCIVALCDQWYLDYGNEGWKLQVKKALENLETYSSEIRNTFENTLDWLHEHACSRTYGLGTKLPWDESWLIESLSDSTIYMAYYTVAHLLQSGHLIGSDTTSPLGIKPEQMTPDVWDYILLGDESCFATTKIPEENLKLMRREFSFWYPMDFRSSGKDLIPNHLTFSLYHHCAIWDEEPGMWPRGFRANGHLQLNGEKMSKSTGNFLTLEGAINLYGADAVRFALADAGDGIDDANFVDKQAEVGLLKLFNYLRWCEDTLESLNSLRNDDASSYADRAFDNEMNKLIIETKGHFDKMMFREALRSGFFVYQELRTKYKELCGPNGIHGMLTKRFIETQAILMSSICPHIAQKIWALLGHAGFIANACWPQVESFDEDLSRSFTYLNDSVHEFRVRYRAFQMASKPKKGPIEQGSQPKPAKATIYVAKTFPPWQATICQIMHQLFIEHNGELPDNKTISRELAKCDSLKKYMKKAMPFAEFRRQIFAKIGERAFDAALPFDEAEILQNNLGLLKSSLEIESITIKESLESDDPKIIEDCSPTDPAIKFTLDTVT